MPISVTEPQDVRVTGEQFRAARALVRMEQRELAERADVSVETIKRIERQRGPVSANVATVDALQEVLEAAGVVFIQQNGGGPGVRLKE